MNDLPEEHNPNEWATLRAVVDRLGLRVTCHDKRCRTYRGGVTELRMMAEVVASRGGFVGTICWLGNGYGLVADLEGVFSYTNEDGSRGGRWVFQADDTTDDQPLYWSVEDQGWTTELDKATVCEDPGKWSWEASEAKDGYWRYKLEMEP